VRLIIADDAWEDYLYWQKQDKRKVERINKLIRERARALCGSRQIRAIEACPFRILVTPNYG